MKKAWVLSYPLRASKDWSDWVDAQADLSLRWVQSFCWFCHEAAHFMKTSSRELSQEAWGTYTWAATWQNQWPVCPAKTTQSDEESSLSAWGHLGSLATHWAHSKYSDKTEHMPRLIWVFAGCTCHLVGFVVRRLTCSFCLGFKNKIFERYHKSIFFTSKHILPPWQCWWLLSWELFPQDHVITAQFLFFKSIIYFSCCSWLTCVAGNLPPVVVCVIIPSCLREVKKRRWGSSLWTEVFMCSVTDVRSVF